MTSELEQFLSMPLGCGEAPLNKLELTSVCSLMAYTACDQKVPEALIEEAVIQQFGVKDVTEIQSKSFDDVIRFLVKLQAGLLLN
jgi:hypothetical protein